jgi:hypothetical protein
MPPLVQAAAAITRRRRARCRRTRAAAKTARIAPPVRPERSATAHRAFARRPPANGAAAPRQPSASASRTRPNPSAGTAATPALRVIRRLIRNARLSVVTPGSLAEASVASSARSPRVPSIAITTTPPATRLAIWAVASPKSFLVTRAISPSPDATASSTITRAKQSPRARESSTDSPAKTSDGRGKGPRPNGKGHESG